MPDVPGPADAADAWPHLTAGAVVDGRWVVARSVARFGEAILLDAVDRSMGDRPVVLVAVRGMEPSAAIALWRDASAVGAIPALDVVAIRDGVVGVFLAGEGASRLTTAQDLSRAQRAALWVDAWSVLEGLRDEGVGARIGHPALLWSWGRRADARLAVIAVPSDDDAWSADAPVVARMLAGALWGTGDDGAIAELLDTLPDDVATALRPCFESEPDPSRAPSAAALGMILGAGDASHRVPVPVARAPRRGPDATWASRRSRVTRAAGRGIAVASVVIALLAAAFAALLEATDQAATVASTVASAPEPVPVEAPVVERELPMPAILTRPWEERLIDWGDPLYFRDFEHGTTLGLMAEPLEGPPDANVPWVRVYLQSDRVARVDRFAADGQLVGFELVTWQDNEHTVLWHSPAGRIERETVYADGGRVLRERAAGGRSTEPGCHDLRLTLDAAGRAESSRCVNRAGDVIPFPGGFDRLAFRYDEGALRPSEQRLVDAQGRLVNGADGWSVLQLTWDEYGRVTRRATFDRDGRLVRDPTTGAAIEVTSWLDDLGVMRRSLHGPGEGALRPFELPDLSGEDTRVEGLDGWHVEEVVRRPGGEKIVRTTLGVDGERALDRAIGAAVTQHTLDEYGHVVDTEWFDVDRQPVPLVTGLIGPTPVRTSYVVDEHGRAAHECDYGGDEQPIASARLGGAHCVVYWRDGTGRVTAVAWYNTELAPTTQAELGAHRIEYELELRGSVEQGRVIAESRFDIEGGRVPLVDNAVSVRTTYNAFGDIAARQYVGRNGEPASMSEPDRYTWTWDALGNWTSHCRFHSGGADAEREAPCVVRTIEGDRVTRITFTDATGEVPIRTQLVDEPTLRPAHVDFVYDDYGLLEEQVLRNEYGEPLQVEPLDCSQARRCVDATGRAWYGR